VNGPSVFSDIPLNLDPPAADGSGPPAIAEDGAQNQAIAAVTHLIFPWLSVRGQKIHINAKQKIAGVITIQVTINQFCIICSRQIENPRRWRGRSGRESGAWQTSLEHQHGRDASIHTWVGGQFELFV